MTGQMWAFALVMLAVASIVDALTRKKENGRPARVAVITLSLGAIALALLVTLVASCAPLPDVAPAPEVLPREFRDALRCAPGMSVVVVRPRFKSTPPLIGCDSTRAAR